MLPLLIGPALGALSIYAGYQMAASSREDAAKRKAEEADAKQRQKEMDEMAKSNDWQTLQHMQGAYSGRLATIALSKPPSLGAREPSPWTPRAAHFLTRR